MGKKTNLTLFIPSLNSTQLSEKLINQIISSGIDIDGKNLSANTADLTAFNYLFSQSKITPTVTADSISRYFELFQLTDLKQNNSSSLPLSRIFFSNLDEKETKHINYKNRWIYNISPVFLYPDMDQLVFSEDLSNQISDQLAADICIKINQFFNQTAQDKSWELVYFSKKQWFLISDFPLINQALPEEAQGKPLTIPKLNLTSANKFPQQEENFNYWTQTLNEIQMLLFSLNSADLHANNHSQCNSLWLWGESFFSENKVINNKNSWDRVYSDNYFVQQLCLYTQTDYKSEFNLSEIISYGQKAAVQKASGKEERTLVVLSDIEQVIKTKDPYAIFETLNQYEQQWFIPIKQAVLSGLLYVNIFTNGQQTFQINKRTLKSWWKRSKSTGKILESLD